MNEKIKYGFILGMTCLLAGGILSGVNALTQPQIKLQKEKDGDAALKKIFPGASEFKTQSTDGKPLYYSVLDNNRKLTGFVLEVSGHGYASDIQVLAGVNLKLEITDVLVVADNETPGLGSRVAEDSFRAQFKGKTSESVDQVQAITGATISSRAVINSIKNKLQEVKPSLLQEIANAG